MLLRREKKNTPVRKVNPQKRRAILTFKTVLSEFYFCAANTMTGQLTGLRKNIFTFLADFFAITRKITHFDLLLAKVLPTKPLKNTFFLPSKAFIQHLSLTRWDGSDLWLFFDRDIYFIGKIGGLTTNQTGSDAQGHETHTEFQLMFREREIFIFFGLFMQLEDFCLAPKLDYTCTGISMTRLFNNVAQTTKKMSSLNSPRKTVKITVKFVPFLESDRDKGIYDFLERF